MVALANVSLTNTFDQWRIRFNQLIVKTNDSEPSISGGYDKANAAYSYVSLVDANTKASFDKANSANLLAYNVGINTNTFLLAVISGANTAIGTGANLYSASVGVSANTFAASTISGANSAVGAGANAYTSTTIANANLVVGAGANNYLLTVIAGANTAVGTGANNYLLTVIAGANSAVGAGANAYAATVGAGANNYQIAIQNGANTAVGAGANSVGIAAFAKANSALANATGTFVGSLTLTSNVNVLSGNSTFIGSGYSVRGQTTTTGLGGIIGYSQNGSVYGILGHTNAWAFYGIGDGYVSGSFYAAGNITAYYSDRRLKKDIVIIPNSIELIKQISGVYYKQNEVAKQYGYDSEETQIGVIAQEIQKVIPQAVAPAPFDTDVIDGKKVSKSGENYLTVLPDKIIPVLIEAIKKLDERLSAIEQRLE